MRIREGDLQSLAAAIVDAVLQQGFVHPKADAAVLRRRIVELVAHNLEEEQALEEEAERLAQTHARQMAGMDQRRIIQGIKERLARERDFPCDVMRFSEGRKSYLAHLIVRTLTTEGLADIENERHVLMEIKRVLDLDHVIDERIDAMVRKKIASLSRRVTPGSSEWDVLYRQYYEEESRKVKSRRA